MLEGIRIVELGMWIAGPATGGLLADWGADVVKVEAPGGDPARYLYDSYFGSTAAGSPPFDAANRGKRSIVVDLSADAGREVLDRLLGTADVFLTNLRQGALERLGIAPAELRRRFPRLVYALITAYGYEGPDRDAAGYDAGAFWARSGAASRFTPPGHEPPIVAGGYGDQTTAISGAAAVLGGLLHQQRTGEGQVVTTSLLRTGMYCIAAEMATRLGIGRVTPAPTRRSTANPLMNCYPTGDGNWLWLLCAESQRHWPKLVAALGDPALDDERYDSTRGRRKHSAELVEHLDRILQEHPRAHWAERFAEHDVWWSPVNTPEDLLSDPQVLAAGGFAEMRGRAADQPTAVVPAGPIDFHADARHAFPPPPVLAEHTLDLLMELGYDTAAVDSLTGAGAVTVAAEAAL